MSSGFNAFVSDKLLWFILGASCLLAYYNFFIFFIVFNLIFWALIFLTRKPLSLLRTSQENNSFYLPIDGQVKIISSEENKTSILIENSFLNSWGIVSPTQLTVSNIQEFKAKKYWRIKNLVREKIYLKYRIELNDDENRIICFEVFSSIFGLAPQIHVDVGDELVSGAVFGNFWGLGAIKIILDKRYALLVETGQKVDSSSSVLIQRDDKI